MGTVTSPDKHRHLTNLYALVTSSPTGVGRAIPLAMPHEGVRVGTAGRAAAFEERAVAVERIWGRHSSSRPPDAGERPPINDGTHTLENTIAAFATITRTNERH